MAEFLSSSVRVCVCVFAPFRKLPSETLLSALAALFFLFLLQFLCLFLLLVSPSSCSCYCLFFVAIERAISRVQHKMRLRKIKNGTAGKISRLNPPKPKNLLNVESKAKVQNSREQKRLKKGMKTETK